MPPVDRIALTFIGLLVAYSPVHIFVLVAHFQVWSPHRYRAM